MKTKLIKFTRGLSKFLEVMAWISTAILTVSGIVGIIFRGTFWGGLKKYYEEGKITTNEGLTIDIFSRTDAKSTIVLLLLLVSYVSVLVVLALIFNNICKIFDSETPFCELNVLRVKRIGIFAMITPLCGLLGDILINVIADSSNATFNLSNFVFGFIILCLSQYFQYGSKLEKDVDGLV